MPSTFGSLLGGVASGITVFVFLTAIPSLPDMVGEKEQATPAPQLAAPIRETPTLAYPDLAFPSSGWGLAPRQCVRSAALVTCEFLAANADSAVKSVTFYTSDSKLYDDVGDALDAAYVTISTQDSGYYWATGDLASRIWVKVVYSFQGIQANASEIRLLTVSSKDGNFSFENLPILELCHWWSSELCRVNAES